ncbi:MAG TPA: GNAT family protein [Syntrophorhabdales bacterium]|nr:GNAT family protein [Syntrophorhabdales bacterium]
MNILGKLIRLRAIEEEDLPKLHVWANDPEIWYTVSGWHFPYSMESLKKWFSSLGADQNNQRWVIETLDEKKLVGTAGLTNIDWKNSHATCNVIVGEKETRGKGYGTDAHMAMNRYAFEELHFERLDGEAIEYSVFGTNVGMREEGRMKNWYFRKGRYWDKVIQGITKNDYFALVARTKYWE